MFHDHDDIMQEGALKKLYDEFTPEEFEQNTMAVEAKVQDWYSPELSEEEKQKHRLNKNHTGAYLQVRF